MKKGAEIKRIPRLASDTKKINNEALEGKSSNSNLGSFFQTKIIRFPFVSYRDVRLKHLFVRYIIIKGCGDCFIKHLR